MSSASVSMTIHDPDGDPVATVTATSQQGEISPLIELYSAVKDLALAEMANQVDVDARAYWWEVRARANKALQGLGVNVESDPQTKPCPVCGTFDWTMARIEAQVERSDG